MSKSKLRVSVGENTKCNFNNIFLIFRFCTDNFGSVLLRCKQNQPFISIDGKVVPYCPSKYKLECEAPVIQHYAYPVEGCDKSNIGVVAGYVNRVRVG